MLKIFSFLLICILAGCENFVSLKKDTNLRTRSTEQTQQLEIANQNQSKAEPELTVKMERFSWTHNLLYKLQIQPDGKVVFEGTENTKTKGKTESKLEKEEMERLLAEIETSNFFSLDSGYGYRFKNCPLAVSDNESVKIYVNLNGKEKTIDHNLGCLKMTMEELKQDIDRKERIFPQKLYKLENKIDEIVETKRWIGEME